MKPWRKRWLLREGARALLVIALSTFAWLYHYRFFDEQKLSEPIDYWGDALFVGGLVKACEQGSYVPVLPKTVWTHGAPDGAHWDDFPIPEQVVYCGVGWLARVVGLFTAINLGYIGGICLAALSLYVVARMMRARSLIAGLFGVLYGMSPYMMGRSVHHYNLVFFWFLPFVVLACMWLGSRRGVQWRSRKFWVGLAVAACAGIHNPYYLNFTLQLFVLAGLAGHLRHREKRSELKVLAAWIGCAIGVAFFINAHSISYASHYGPNREVAGRSAQDLEQFALKPIELVFPHQPHDLAPFQKAAENYDRTQRVLRSERSYLGLVGAAALLWMFGAMVVGLLRRTNSFAVDLGLLATWLMVYSLPAGLNATTGLLGITLFRSTNRVSIVLMTISSLVVAVLITRATRKLKSLWLAPIVALVLLGAIVEQLFPRWPVAQLAAVHARADSDRVLMEQLQTRIPKGSRVFQLPIVGFPEESFEPFRPFFYSEGLSFSFGAMRGRPEAQWMSRTAALAPEPMFQELQRSGFRAIVTLGDSSALFNALKPAHPDLEYLRSPNGTLTAIVLPPTGSAAPP